MFKRIVSCFAVLLVLFSCSNNNNPEINETFVTQTSNPNDLRCGAFSMAFYKWLKEGKTYSLDQTADYNTVDNIYSAIKFGSAYSSVYVTGMGTINLSQSSNPLNLLHYANSTLGYTSAEFYRDETIQQMEDIYNAISANDGTLLGTYSSKSKTGGIPSLSTGQYAIVVFLVSDIYNMPLSLHWILFHKTTNGYEYYDPYFGKPLSATEAQLRGSTHISVNYAGIGQRKLKSFNSCLLLP
jgi:hypothetical protein